jgi:hypothetical protein
MPAESPSQVVLNFFSSWKNVASSSLTNSTPFCAFLAQMTASGGSGSAKPSCAHSRPVAPQPVWTSSKSSGTSKMRVRSRRRCMNDALVIRTPPSPWIGSTNTAATRWLRLRISDGFASRRAVTNAMGSWPGPPRNASIDSSSRRKLSRRRSASVRRPETSRSQSCFRLRSSRRASSFALPPSAGNETCGHSNVGNPSRAFFRCVAARLPSVRPWNAPSNETMKPPRASPEVMTRFRAPP